MRGVATALIAAACLVAACDDVPENQYAAACLNAVRDDNAAYVFGTSATGVAEAFCTCVGEETTQSKQLDSTDKQKILAYLGAFDTDQDVVAVFQDYSKFRRRMGPKYPAFYSVMKTCKRRLAN